MCVASRLEVPRLDSQLGPGIQSHNQKEEKHLLAKDGMRKGKLKKIPYHSTLVFHTLPKLPISIFV